ncbi:MAG TPA: hypothetical protein VMW38_17515 [Terriglobia bacterium]|nr:hypothetical protein [Terriglobia bacterium]
MSATVSWRQILLGAVLLILINGDISPVLAVADFSPTSSAFHAYIDSNIILSLELTPKKECFVEILNMGKTRRCLTVDNIYLRTEEGKPLKLESFLYDGSQSKTAGGERACALPDTRRKWEVGYNFDFPSRVRKVFFLMGNTAFRLQPLSQSEFQDFTANLDKINIGESSEYLKVFNLRVMFGKNIYGSSVRCRKVNISPATEGTRGPITLISTTPRQTEQAYKKKKGGEVPMKIKLDANGEVVDVTPEVMLEYGLTERAVYEVKNWWEFAPAFEEGKPIPSEHTVTAIFRVEEEDED